MPLHVVNKGKTGEREVADMLNFCVFTVLQDEGYAEDECLAGMRTFQRNQLQTAIGGSDLDNSLELSIEVKRQETLAVSSWWAQCEKSALNERKRPILIYRQNRKPWRIMMHGYIPLTTQGSTVAIVEIDLDSFKAWFRVYVKHLIEEGRFSCR